MLGWRFFRGVVALPPLALSAAVIAQPPPPPPPGMPDYVALLDRSYNDRRLTDYGALFAPDVRVYDDGRVIAADRTAMLDLVRGEFARNLHVASMSWAQGGQILVMQEVQGCIPEHPVASAVYHGCPHGRAIRYDLGDHDLITAVHILDADRAWNMHPAAN